MSFRPTHRTPAALLAALVTAVLMLTACGGTPTPSTDPSPDGEAIRTIDTVHGSIQVPTQPQRIVAVSYDTPWQLMSLGVTIVGAQDYTNFMASMSDERKAYIADVAPIGSYGDPNFEAIAALDPDLIVGDSYEIDDNMFKRLSEIAPTVAASGEYRGDWKAIVTTLAGATNATDALTAAQTAYDAKVAEIKETHADTLAEKRFALITFGTSESNFSVMYPTGVVGSLYAELGVTFAPGIPDDEPEAGYIEFTAERIPELLGEADIIIAPATADGSTYDALKPLFANPLFEKLPAAQAGHVFELTLGVTDYATATDYLDRVQNQVFSQL